MLARQQHHRGRSELLADRTELKQRAGLDLHRVLERGDAVALDVERPAGAQHGER